jgi:hypothetical protein
MRVFAMRVFAAEGFADAAGAARADFGLECRAFAGVTGFAAGLAARFVRLAERGRAAGPGFADGLGAGFAAVVRLAFAPGRAGFFATRVRRNVDLAMAGDSRCHEAFTGHHADARCSANEPEPRNPDEDEIDRDDIVEQTRNEEDQNSGQKGHQRLKVRDRDHEQALRDWNRRKRYNRTLVPASIIPAGSQDGEAGVLAFTPGEAT